MKTYRGFALKKLAVDSLTDLVLAFALSEQGRRHRLTARETARPQDLVGEIFIGGPNKASVLRAVTEDYLRRSGLGARHKSESRRRQHGDGHVSLVASTRGLALMPSVTMS